MFRTSCVHHQEDHLYMQFCMVCFSYIYVCSLAGGRMCSIRLLKCLIFFLPQWREIWNICKCPMCHWSHLNQSSHMLSSYCLYVHIWSATTIPCAQMVKQLQAGNSPNKTCMVLMLQVAIFFFFCWVCILCKTNPLFGACPHLPYSKYAVIADIL